jgi:hypothetical protein
MKSLRYLVFLFTGVIACTAVRAQKTEFGIMGGGSMYYGDIVNEFEFNSMGGSCGVYLRYHISDKIAIKGFGSYCRVTGADSNSSSKFQQNRNLSFWSNIYEGSVQLEINFVDDIIRGNRIVHRFIPYGFVGLGAFYFTTYATDPTTGKPVDLRKLHTDGKSYDPFSFCIPLGLGLRCKLSPNVSLGLECGFRYTGTTYIDDVGGVNSTYPSISSLPSNTSIVMYDRSKVKRSAETGYGYGQPGKQRGKIAINDMYAVFGVTLGYRLEYVKAGVLHGKSVTRLRF